MLVKFCIRYSKDQSYYSVSSRFYFNLTLNINYCLLGRFFYRKVTDLASPCGNKVSYTLIKIYGHLLNFGWPFIIEHSHKKVLFLPRFFCPYVLFKNNFLEAKMFLNYFKINLIITFVAVYLPTLNGMLGKPSSSKGKEVVENEKKHALFIAPNFIPYHFEMASRCADLLAKDYYVVGD